LNEHGIEMLGFGGNETHEPTVIGWMPSAQIYFRDPDGHTLEFISILSDPPKPGFNGPYSEWKRLTLIAASEPLSRAEVFAPKPKSARAIQTSSFRNFSRRPP